MAKQTVTTDQIANAIQPTLDKTIRRFLDEAKKDDGLAEQIKSLEKQMAEDQPAASRDAMSQAVRQLREAQSARLQPVLEKIATAIVHVTREHGIPLAVKASGQQARQTTQPTGRGKNQQFILDYLAEHKGARVSDVTQAAEEAGLNRTSIPSAVKALEDAGRITSTLPRDAKRNPVLSVA